MDPGNEIFILKVHIKDSVDLIKVHENDEPSVLAGEFAEKHSLDSDSKVLIEKEIEKRIDEILTTGPKHVTIIEEAPNYDNKDLFTSCESHKTLKNTEALRVSDLQSTMYSSITKDINRSMRSCSPVKLKPNNKLYQFSQLFKYLNPNAKGKITMESILKINLKNKLSKILMPIIIDIDNSKLELTFGSFCKKMEVLLKYLTPRERDYLSMPSYQFSFINQRESHRSNSPSKLSIANGRKSVLSTSYHN